MMAGRFRTYEYDLKRRKAVFNRIYELLNERTTRECIIEVFRSITEVIDKIDEIPITNDLRNLIINELAKIIEYHKKEG